MQQLGHMLGYYLFLVFLLLLGLVLKYGLSYLKKKKDKDSN